MVLTELISDPCLNLVYFEGGEELNSFLGKRMILWQWNLNPETFNITNFKDSPIGNLKNFMDGDSLTINFELIAMTNLNIMKRLLQDKTTYGEDQEMYIELGGNRFRAPTEKVYRDSGNYDCTIVSIDREAYFVCHKKMLVGTFVQHYTPFHKNKIISIINFHKTEIFVSIVVFRSLCNIS